MAKRSHNRDDSVSNVVVGIMVGIIIMLCAILAYSNWPRIAGWIGLAEETQTPVSGTPISSTTTPVTETPEPSNGLFVGKELGLSGTLRKGGDLTSYSHTLETEQYGTLGLKSTSVSLNEFKGTVVVGGIVDDYINGVYIIRVNTLVPVADESNDKDDTSGDSTILTGVQYVADGAIALADMKEAGFIAFVDKSAQEIRIAQSGDLEKEVTLEYFLCNPAKNSTNCTATRNNLIGASRVDYTDSYGYEFYILPDSNSWFGTIGDFGYYVSAPDKTTFSRVMSYVSFVSEKYAKSLLQDHMKELCKNDNYTLVSLNSFELSRDGKDLIAVLKGTDYTDNIVECSILMDPTQSRGGTLKMIQVLEGDKEENKDENDADEASEEENEEENNEETTEENNEQTGFTSSVTKDESVTQFKINLEETLDYVAKMGFTIKFPSKSIYFSADNTKTDLGHEGLNCYVDTKVVGYKKKDSLETDPDVNVYVCTDNANLEASLKEEFLVYRDEENNRMYLTKINYPEWFDFASNIVIK